MTNQETVKLLAAIQATYPNFQNGRDPKVTINVWQKCFEDEPYSEVSQALMSFIVSDTKGFAPVPGQIKERIAAMHEEAEGLTEVAAWALVSKAISNSIYNSVEEFNKLPQTVRNTIGNPAVLREWAFMDESEVYSVVSSNFMRSYRARKATEKETAKLPSSIRAMLPQLNVVGLVEHTEQPRLQETYCECPEQYSIRNIFSEVIW